jgi:hypothetical protein
LPSLQQPQRVFGAGGRPDHLMPQIDQAFFQHHGEQRLIFDHQHAHVCSPGGRRRVPVPEGYCIAMKTDTIPLGD